MNVIRPTSVTDAMLISSTAPETDHAAWSAATAYAVGNRVIRVVTHRIYERLVAGTTATAPENDPVNWLDVGPTNRWAMFDNEVSTATTIASPLTVVLAPGLGNSLALLGLVGDQAVVTVTDGPGGPTVYSRTISLLDGGGLADWYEYFFGVLDQLGEVVLADLPPYLAARVTVTITGVAPVACGVCVVGSSQPLGDTLASPTAGITDYSRKVTDEFGATAFVRRAYAKRMSARTVLPTGQINRVQRLLADLRATPCVWFGALDTTTYAPLAVFGWYREFSIDVAFPQTSYCTLEIEGLT